MDDGELRAHFERIDERFRDSDERFDRMMAMIAGLFEASEKRRDERFQGLERRLDAFERRTEERFIAVQEQMATMRLSREQFERRMMGEVEGLKGGMEGARGRPARPQRAGGRALGRHAPPLPAGG